MIEAYGRDPEFQPRLERLLQSLDDDLRLVVVMELERFSLRQDSFAIEVLSGYVREHDGPTRVAAARAYYSALKASGSAVDTLREKLLLDMLVTGPDFETRRQACIAGLLALDKPEALLDPRLRRQDA